MNKSGNLHHANIGIVGLIMSETNEQETSDQITETPQTGRKRCPKCNGTKLRKTEDRSRPLLSQYGVFEGTQTYKKYWKCGECGEKFE